MSLLRRIEKLENEIMLLKNLLGLCMDIQRKHLDKFHFEAKENATVVSAKDLVKLPCFQVK